ncbi:carotenoid biosynthesis protein [Nocardia sp. NPDC004068]|uniref:carotenoid biosynthesis protein n=1 Tax=Nocardia sp. NPDC004068 TaxID=3364303 RepID=UPI0036C57A2D
MRAVPALAAIAWIAVQIGYPLTAGGARDAVTIVVVLLAVATALTHALVDRGARFAAGFLLIVSGLGLVAEMVGTATGFPFGCYHYAVDRLGPAVAGVPVLIPLAWTGGLYPVWVVAGWLARRAPARVVLTAVGAVGWDLYLDPQMVADGQWSWCSNRPGLPGLSHIPWTNYVGWFVVALVMAALMGLLARAHPARGVSGAVPLVVFGWTWLGSALAHAVFLGLPASAAYGFAGLGVLGIPLAAQLGRRARRVPLDPACHGTM